MVGRLAEVPSVSGSRWRPLWQRLHAPVLAFLVASAAVALWVGWRGTWSRERAGARLLVDVFGLLVACLLFSADSVVVITATGHAELAKTISHFIDRVVWWAGAAPGGGLARGAARSRTVGERRVGHRSRTGG